MNMPLPRLMWGCVALLVGGAGVTQAQPPEQLREVRSWKADEDVGRVAISPDGKRIMASIHWVYIGGAKSVQVWDAETGRELLRLKGSGAGRPTGAQFSPDGKRIVAPVGGRTIIVWDAETGKEVCTLKGHNQLIRSVAISRDGKHIVSGSKGLYFNAPGDETCNNDVRVWDAATGKLLRTIEVNGGVAVVAISPDGKQISSIDGSDNGTGKVVVWNLETGKQVRALTLKGPQDGNFAGARFSPDGKRIAYDFSTTKPTLIIRDAETGKELRTIELPMGRHGSIAFSPDGKRIAYGCVDYMLRLLDIETGRVVAVSKKGSEATGSLAFSSDGNWIVQGNQESRVTIWAIGK